MNSAANGSVQLPAPHEICLLFSTADWRTPYWTNKQHMAQLLARRGWRVLYVESVGLRTPNVTSKRDWCRLWTRLWRGLKALLVGPEYVAENVWVLPPLVLPVKQGHPVVYRLNQWLLRQPIDRFIGSSRGSAQLSVWAYHPYIIDAIRNVAVTRLIYHCVDDLAAIPGVDTQAFNRQEIDLLHRCDVVFVTAPALQEKCAQHNRNTHCFPNVVDFEHFARATHIGKLPLEVEAIPEPRLVYHGVLSDFKVDFKLLKEVALGCPTWHLVLIGEEREGQSSPEVRELKGLSNVHFLGYRKYEVLPDYLRGMQVGLLPTMVNEYTRAMFPMKFYEYLAAGLPVVSTPLDFTRGGHAALQVGDGVGAFIAAIEQQLRRGRLDESEPRLAVGSNTWGARMDLMVSILQRTEGHSSECVTTAAESELRGMH